MDKLNDLKHYEGLNNMLQPAQENVTCCIWFSLFENFLMSNHQVHLSAVCIIKQLITQKLKRDKFETSRFN